MTQKLYFLAADKAGKEDLWTTDGTTTTAIGGLGDLCIVALVVEYTGHLEIGIHVEGKRCRYPDQILASRITGEGSGNIAKRAQGIVSSKSLPVLLHQQGRVIHLSAETAPEPVVCPGGQERCRARGGSAARG